MAFSRIAFVIIVKFAADGALACRTVAILSTGGFRLGHWSINMSVIAGIRAVSCCACADFSGRKGQDIIAEPGPGIAVICINQVIETREIVAVLNISLRVDS